MSRQCRYTTHQPHDNVDDVALRLKALWTILTTNEPLVIGEAADDRLLDWVASTSTRSRAARRPCRHTGPVRPAGARSCRGPGLQLGSCSRQWR